MATLTWGTDGTYANLILAYAATDATYTEDVILLQVGDSDEDDDVLDLTKDQDGFTLTVTGNPAYTCEQSAVTNATFVAVGDSANSASGPVVIQDLRVSFTAASDITVLSITNATGTSSAHSLDIRRCVFRHTIAGNSIGLLAVATNTGKRFTTVDIYNNYLDYDDDGSSLDGINIDANEIAGTTYHIEDNMILNDDTATGNVFILVAAAAIKAAVLTLRNYCKGFAGAIESGDEDLPDITTELFAHDTHAELDADNSAKPFTTVNFYDIVYTESMFGIPKPTSTLYTTATQTTGITANTLDLRGETVVYKAVGPYTPITITQPVAPTPRYFPPVAYTRD